MLEHQTCIGVKKSLTPGWNTTVQSPQTTFLQVASHMNVRLDQVHCAGAYPHS